jgi:hypothetical protein
MGDFVTTPAESETWQADERCMADEPGDGRPTIGSTLGNNWYGHLGDGTSLSVLVPVTVIGL